MSVFSICLIDPFPISPTNAWKYKFTPSEITTWARKLCSLNIRPRPMTSHSTLSRYLPEEQHAEFQQKETVPLTHHYYPLMNYSRDFAWTSQLSVWTCGADEVRCGKAARNFVGLRLWVGILSTWGNDRHWWTWSFLLVLSFIKFVNLLCLLFMAFE